VRRSLRAEIVPYRGAGQLVPARDIARFSINVQRPGGRRPEDGAAGG
jgi:hypothetical protein